LALVAGTTATSTRRSWPLHRLRASSTRAALSGTVILVHVANLSRSWPDDLLLAGNDGKNLNRVFPGRADGSQTERVRPRPDDEVLERADYLADPTAATATRRSARTATGR